MLSMHTLLHMISLQVVKRSISIGLQLQMRSVSRLSGLPLPVQLASRFAGICRGSSICDRGWWSWSCEPAEERARPSLQHYSRRQCALRGLCTFAICGSTIGCCLCRFNEQLTHLEQMGEIMVLGGNAGGVHLVNVESGDLLASPKMEDHEGPVTGLSAHMTLRHFISCGADGMIKVFACCRHSYMFASSQVAAVLHTVS